MGCVAPRRTAPRPPFQRCSLPLQVRHDGAGRGAGWHLAWVKASNLTTGAVAMFKCARWVDRREPADPAIVAVVVSLPPDQAAAAAGGQRSAKDRLLLLGRKTAALAGLGGGGNLAASTAAAALQAPLVQGVRMEAGLGGSPGQAALLGGDGGEEGAGGLPGYRVVFHTSRMCGSGTRAKVRCCCCCCWVRRAAGSSRLSYSSPARTLFQA